MKLNDLHVALVRMEGKIDLLHVSVKQQQKMVEEHEVRLHEFGAWKIRTTAYAVALVVISGVVYKALSLVL
jgi:hypothetical protein